MAKSAWKFEDNSAKFLREFKECGLDFLIEAKESLVSQAQRNTPVKTGDLKRSFGEDSFVDEDEMTAYIGSSKEYAIWVERGTGEYAINGDGRKGGWVYQDDNGKVYYTEGMKPKLMLYKAYLAKRKKITSEAAKRFGKLGKG